MRTRLILNQDKNENRSLKINFSTQDRNFNNLQFSKTSSNLDVSTQMHPTGEDIYYDEIIYYDGGDVEGYGY